MTLFDATVLGLVEGITEFLPVSSTGHLILAGAALGLPKHDPLVDSFNVAIQSGAILAVLAIYRRRFAGLFRFNSPGGLNGARGLGLLALTTFPALLLAALFHRAIKEVLFAPLPVALALATGGLAMILIEKRGSTAHARLDSLAPKTALWIGLVQCLSLWPGMSRAAATILGGRFLGLSREEAAEYSFLAAVPILLAATAYELLTNPGLLGQSRGLFAVGFLVSFAVAWVAVKGFLVLLRRWTLAPYGWYRLALALAVFLTLKP